MTKKTAPAIGKPYSISIGSPAFDVGPSLYKELIALANLRSHNAKAMDRFFKAIAPVERTEEREFLVKNSPARELVVQAFSDLVGKTGSLSKMTEHRINNLLSETSFSGVYYLEESEVRSMATLNAPSIEHMCAYGIAALVGAKLVDCVRQCKLSKCRKFFWAPIKRGPRPTYCCERHRVTGAQRESRGGTP